MEEMLTARLSARVTNADWLTVTRAAEAIHLKPAAFIRQAVLTAAQGILATSNKGHKEENAA
jgi:uncharacterized protein (DUF1778 family)